MKKYYFILSVFILIILSILLFLYYIELRHQQFGVLIGVDQDHIDKLTNYDEVVIDAYYFDKSNIDYLHENNVTVYSYLNVGSLEEFRPYYNDFLDMTLDNYENWPDEKWIDLSNSKWQDFIVHVLAKDLDEKGVDGFFIDNVDIYSKYKNPKTFDGVKDILERLKTTYKKPIIVNGGHAFFTDAISKQIDLLPLTNGINVESIYTTIDFEKKSFKIRKSDEREPAIDYLKNMQSLGLDIFVVEYSDNRLLNWRIYYRYKWLGFKFYISHNIELE